MRLALSSGCGPLESTWVASPVDHVEFVVPRSMRTAAALAQSAPGMFALPRRQRGVECSDQTSPAISRPETQASTSQHHVGPCGQSAVLVGVTFKDHQVVVCSLQQGGSITVACGSMSPAATKQSRELTCVMERPQSRAPNRLARLHYGYGWACLILLWLVPFWALGPTIAHSLNGLSNPPQSLRSPQPSSPCKPPSDCWDSGSPERKSSRSSRAPRLGMPSGRSGPCSFMGISGVTASIRMKGDRHATTASYVDASAR
jgi:hypothetical protein